MVTTNPKWLWPVAVGLVLGLIAGIGLGRGTPADPIVILRVDSVLSESPAIRDSLRGLSREATISKREASAFHREADRMKRVADSLKVRQNVIVSADSMAMKDSVAMIPAAAYDTLQAAYWSLSLAAERDSLALVFLTTEASLAESRIATLEATLRTAQAELKRTKRPSRWGVSCVAGYGAVSAGGAVRTGPALACGVSYRLR